MCIICFYISLLLWTKNGQYCYNRIYNNRLLKVNIGVKDLIN